MRLGLLCRVKEGCVQSIQHLKLLLDVAVPTPVRDNAYKIGNAYMCKWAVSRGAEHPDTVVYIQGLCSFLRMTLQFCTYKNVHTRDPCSWT